MTHLDLYNRAINYLRISVTDRCNLRCVYCMPPDGVPPCAHDDILRYEEIETVVRAAARLGISKIRLTGGEPLVRKGLADLVSLLANIPGIDDLSLTTNGTLLPRYAQALARAGLKRVNISLDTLRPKRFAAITRRGSLQDALDGIEAAHRAGLEPVKINSVVIRGLNDDEVIDLAQKSLGQQGVSDGWHIRFIEWMPVGETASPGQAWDDAVVTAAEIRGKIEAALGTLEAAHSPTGAGPARYYRLPGAKGTIGFITPISEHFCQQCNRLRLTADGQLRPCLLSDREIDLRTPLRSGAGVEEIQALLAYGIAEKPEQHHLQDLTSAEKRVMSQIGG
ncbi:MAG: GTP 3',8-cyclase MoaA [Anaerolineae bacterium]|nr:GTP 3',8-cyclase MoaA [Anaerolineae bacterium]